MCSSDLLGDIFGGGSSGGGGYEGGITNLASFLPSFFADGGNPPVGVPSIVGERGPELFIPSTSGTIIPNNQLGSALGNQPSVVYNGTVIQNMSAIDTQSAVQFLSQNKNAVWASYQSAQKSLPQSR